MYNIVSVQVQRSTENQMYSLEVGPNTDIAFITICTAAIDLIHLRSSLTPLGNIDLIHLRSSLTPLGNIDLIHLRSSLTASGNI